MIYIQHRRDQIAPGVGLFCYSARTIPSLNIFSVGIPGAWLPIDAPLFQEMTAEETVSVWFLSTPPRLHWFIPPQSSYPQWDRNHVPPHVIQTLATVSMAKVKTFLHASGEKKDSAGFLITTDCLNKHFLWQRSDKQWASLHILGYTRLNITQTSGWFFFSPPESFHLKPGWEFPLQSYCAKLKQFFPFLFFCV